MIFKNKNKKAKARRDPIRAIPTRTQVLRALGVRQRAPEKRGRVKQGRGRPRGSYTYSIPGKGRVDVFTYRKWLSQQKRMAQQQLQTQIAMQRARSRVIQQKYPELSPEQQQMIAPQSYPQYPQYPQQRPVPIVQPSLKEMSILERTPLTMGSAFAPEDSFTELDLMSGRPKQKRVGSLL